MSLPEALRTAACRRRLFAVVATTLTLILTASIRRSPEAASTFEFLHAFSGESSTSFAGLVQGSDGRLYGTTYRGGQYGRGTVYAAQVLPGGGLSVTTVHEFSGPDGSDIYGRLAVGADGRLYGTANHGGASGMGTIFAFDPAAGFELVHSMSSSSLSGSYMGLVAASDGAMYGISSNDRIFRVTSGGDFTVLASLTDATTGSNARGALIEGADGALYGTGISGGPFGRGTVFRVSKAGAVSIVYGFSAATGEPWGGVMQASDGFLYGTTLSGGASGGGILYRLDPSGTVQILHNYTQATGSSPRAPLIEASDGLLYGTTQFGGSQGRGVVFRIGKTGTPAYAVVQSLTPATGVVPQAPLLQTANGDLYGTTTEFLSTPGRIFTLSLASGAIQAVHSFTWSAAQGPLGLLEGLDGNFYGVTYQGGTYNQGTLFRTGRDGMTSILRSFESASGASPSTLISDPGGLLYGTASSGGPSGRGVVFRVSPDGTGYAVLHSFNGSGGAYPEGRLIRASDGNFYGTTSAGGASNLGTVYRLSVTGAFTLLHSFTGGAAGATPYGELLQASDGFFYGTTSGLFSTGFGTVFRMDSTGLVTTLHVFNNTDGAEPRNGLVEAADGFLYGVAFAGGSNPQLSYGVIYRVSNDGSFGAVADLNPTTGGRSFSSLVASRDGRLYGTGSSGSIFRLNSRTGAVKRLYSFEPSSESFRPFLESVFEGDLVGITEGGPRGGGTIFRFLPDRPPVTSGDSFIGPEDQTLTVAAPGVLGNDTDDGGAITAALIDAPAATDGTLVLNANGSFTFTPAANFFGTTTFSYKALDSLDESDPATVTITITPHNDPPLAADVTLSTLEDTSTSFALPWTDIDNSSVTFRVTANGTKGTATIDAGGTLTYVPKANAFGTDTVSIVASDGTDDSNTATATINITAVNDAPAASDDRVAGAEDAVITIQPLANDIDVDGDALTITGVSHAAHGRLARLGSDRFEYRPLGNYSGPDTFSYSIADGNGLSASATVRIAVAPASDPPVAHGQSLRVVEDVPRALALSGADADDDPLTFRIVASPAHGTLTGTAPALIYNPEPNYSGGDTFTFVVNDGVTDSTPATVTLTTASYAWMSSGPDGGTINVIAPDPGSPRIAYAATDASGIFKTADGGVTWSAVNAGLTALAIQDIVIDPSNPNVVYAGARVGGLWKTTDAGASWSRIDSLQTILTVSRVVLDPRNSAIVYAATGFGLYKSTNAGETWAPMNSGLTASGTIRQLVIDPVTTTTLYAGTGSGVFKTTDGGASWTPANTGLPASPNVLALGISPHHPETLWLSGVSFGQVYRSLDGGATWMLATQGLATGLVRTFAASQTQPGTVYANIFGRVYRSVNDGASWAAHSAEFAALEMSNIAISPANPSVFYAATLGSGAYRSTDEGATWAPANAGLAAAAVVALAADPEQPATLYAGTRGMGAIRSTDGGASWHSRTAGIFYPIVFAIAPDPGVPGTIYAATAFGFYKTVDGGGVWTNSGAGLPSNIQAALVDPSGSGTLYAGTFSDGVYKSADRGASWTAVNTGLTNRNIRALAFDPAAPSTIYAGTTGGVFKTTDAGSTWLRAGAAFSTTVQALAVSGQSPATLYAGTLSGLYRSVDGGATWSLFGLPSETVRAILLEPADASRLMVAAGGGIFRSRNGGQTWVAINAGLADVTASTLLATTGQPRRVFVGTESGAYELVEALNDPPVAQSQQVSLSEDASLAITLAAGDPDGDAVALHVQSQPLHGTLSGVAPALTYTPAPNYHGLDSFSFLANDGSSGSAPATVSITVLPVNDTPVAEDVQIQIAEDTTAAITLLATDADGDSPSYHVVSQPAHGSLSGSGANLTYTPLANFHGTDVFTFRAFDGVADSDVAAVSIAVTAVDDAPVAAADGYTTDEDTPLTAGTGVLDNDADVDGNTLSAILVSGATHGTVSLRADGTFSYLPAANHNGSDSFTYRASDDTLTSSPTLVTIAIRAVNDAPAGAPLSLSTTEDTPAEGTVAALDVDSPSLTFAVIAQGAKGTTSIDGSGVFLYVPVANANGADTVTLGISDGEFTAPVTLTVTVSPVNDPPEATDGTLSTREEESAIGQFAGSDIDSSALEFSIVSNGAKGTAVITNRATGAFLYTPQPNANGSDLLAFRVTDGDLQSEVALVAVSIEAVNDAPAASDGAAAAPKQSPITGQLVATDVDSSGLLYTLVQPPTQGTVTVAANGSYTYISGATATGTDRFTFQADDGAARSNVATITITILAGSGAPIAYDRTLSTQEDTVASASLSAVAQAGRTLTYAIVGTAAKGIATLTNAATGAFTYTPNANENGSDSFTFRVNDGVQTSNLATVSMNIGAVNDVPMATPGTLAVVEDRAETGVLIGTDVDGQALTFAIVTSPLKGVVLITNAATGRYSYQPNADASGTDSFTFKVSDGISDSPAVSVAVAISSVNDAPLAQDISFTTTAGTPLAAILPASDPDSDPLAYDLRRMPRHGTVTLDNPATGEFTYIPAAGFSGQDTFTFVVSDGTRSSMQATVTVMIKP
jgi:large repetitive protein